MGINILAYRITTNKLERERPMGALEQGYTNVISSASRKQVDLGFQTQKVRNDRYIQTKTKRKTTRCTVF